MSTKLTLNEIDKQLDKKDLSDKLKADLKFKANVLKNNKEVKK